MDNSLLPPTTLDTLITGSSAVVSANILPILGILGFALGVKMAWRAFDNATLGRFDLVENYKLYKYKKNGL